MSTSSSSNVRFKFFVQTSSGKRSFQLREDDLTEKKMALMSTLSSFFLKDMSTNEEIFPNKDGNFDVKFVSEHEYQVMQKKEQSETTVDGYVNIGTVVEVESTPTKRKRVAIHGRDVTIFLFKSASKNSYDISAIDSVCYHLGGPLIEGDIEDVGGHSCIVCPWHRYKIDLNNGDGLITSPDGISSKGARQRTHHVKVDNGNILVKLMEGGELASDHYAMMGLYKFPTSKTPPKLHSKQEQQ